MGKAESLKACPNEHEVVKGVHIVTIVKGGGNYVACSDCGKSGPRAYDPEGAVEAWDQVEGDA